MGVLVQGILGGVRGKVGAVVGASWKGIAVLKAKPLSVANPRTAGQVAQRSKMSNVVAFAQVLLSTVIKPLWDRFAQRASGYNDFVSANIANFEGALPTTFADLVISRGKMAATAISALKYNGVGGNVEIEWDDDAGEGFKLASDMAYCVIINETTGEVLAPETYYLRSSRHILADLATAPQVGDVIHCYLAFRREDGTIVSNGSYATSVVA